MSLPLEISSADHGIVEEVDPQAENISHKIKLKDFDEDIYIKGVIHYNNEQFDECIKNLDYFLLKKVSLEMLLKDYFCLLILMKKLEGISRLCLFRKINIV